MKSQTWKKKIWRHLGSSCTLWFPPNTKRMLENSQVRGPAYLSFCLMTLYIYICFCRFVLILASEAVTWPWSLAWSVLQACYWSCQVLCWLRCCRMMPCWPQLWRKPWEPCRWHRNPGTEMASSLSVIFKKKIICKLHYMDKSTEYCHSVTFRNFCERMGHSKGITEVDCGAVIVCRYCKRSVCNIFPSLDRL